MNPTNVIASGSSAGQFDPLQHGITSPYASCQKVLIVDQTQYDNHGGFKGSKLPGTCESVQAMPSSGEINGLANATNVLELSRDVADIYLDHLKQKASDLSALLNCYPAKGQTAKNCDPKMQQALQQEIAEGAPALRQEMALANVPINAGGKFQSTSPSLASHVPGPMDALSGLPSPLAGQPLTADELAAAKAQLAKETSGVTTGALSHGGFWRSIQSEHQLNYQTMVYGQYPIFATLDKPSSWSNGQPSWSNDQIHNALESLAKDVGKEQALTQHAIDKGTIEFDQMGQLKQNLMGGNRDLMAYMAFRPIVDQVLKNHPEWCGLATGVDNHISTENMEQNLALMAGTTVAMVGASYATGFTGDPAVFAAATAARAALALSTANLGIGLGMSGAYIASSVNNYHMLKQQLKTSALASEAQDVTPEQVQSAKDAIYANAAFGALVLGGVGQVARGIEGVKVADAATDFAKISFKGATDETRPTLIAAVESANPTKLRAAVNGIPLPSAQKARLLSEIDRVTDEVKAAKSEIFNAVASIDPKQAVLLSGDAEITKLVVQAENRDHNPVSPKEMDKDIQESVASCPIGAGAAADAVPPL
jgi:hypothetical protein